MVEHNQYGGFSMEIVDSHAHVFPYLGGSSGYASVEEHLLACQRAMHNHLAQPVRRAQDGEEVHESTLWAPDDPSLAGRYEVGFRAGEFGRFEWSRNGVEYYIQYMPTGLEDMTAPPDLLLAMMDCAGVDGAVLQCGRVYGRLNAYYATLLSDRPELEERLFPLFSLEAGDMHTKEGINRLERAVLQSGLRGLHVSVEETTFKELSRPFWNRVEQLKIPVFFAFSQVQETWISTLKAMDRWVNDYPTVPCVIPQAWPLSTVEPGDEIQIPEFARALARKGRVLFEIAYPIGRGGIEDYPYMVARQSIRKLYEAFGPRSLVWGSDAPNVERYCTYGQSLAYLLEGCDFIAEKDMELIVGGNLKEVLSHAGN